MTNEQNRVRKAREEYEAKQALQKRIQDARESLQKPGVLLKMSIVVGACLILSLGLLDPVFKLTGIAPH